MSTCACVYIYIYMCVCVCVCVFVRVRACRVVLCSVFRQQSKLNSFDALIARLRDNCAGSVKAVLQAIVEETQYETFGFLVLSR